jgi:DNA polymerase-3 subunit epsilon
MELQEAAQQLQASENFRVLQRVPPVDSWNLQPVLGETVRACIVDCETTGLESDAEVCELGILPFDYCKETGRVVAVHKGLSRFRETVKPIPAEATAVHGITNEMVAGHAITDADVAAAVGDANLLIAFNAKFDRAKVATPWPLLDTIPWGCAYEDVAWKEPGKLGWLLYRYGWFHDGHRAFDDCLATLFLLTQPVGEQSALFAMLQRLREPLYKVMLLNTPYSAKDQIKARGGYRWDDKHPMGKNWWKLASDLQSEIDWFAGVGGSPSAARAVKVLTGLRHSEKVANL